MMLLRAAGDSSHYEIAVIDGAGNPKGVSQYLPSVTTILEALPKYLQWWGYRLGVEATLKKVAEMPPGQALPDSAAMYERLKADKEHTPSTVLSTAAGRGSTVHDWIEARVQQHATGSTGPLPPMDVAHSGYMKAVNSWLPTSDISTVLFTELPVFSLRHGYAGTLDALTYDLKRDCYVVNDWKTNEKGGVYESHQLQVAAYAAAVREMSLNLKELPIRARVVAFSANGKFTEVWSECELDDFLKVKEVWEWLQKMKDKK